MDKLICVGNINPSGNGISGRVYDADGICPTINSQDHGGGWILIEDGKKLPDSASRS